LEQAWIQKMAREIARKVREEKVRLERREAEAREGKRREVGDDGDEVEAERMPPPPAYGAL
jgi:hypothetical protein